MSVCRNYKYPNLLWSSIVDDPLTAPASPSSKVRCPEEHFSFKLVNKTASSICGEWPKAVGLIDDLREKPDTI
jgi:hypothetical protein